MDYFNELLESYNKLKKRTFKLEYISEAEAKAKPKAKPKAKKKETQEETPPPPSDLAFEDGATIANNAINAATADAVPVMGVNGKPTEMSIYRNPQGDVVVVNLYGGEKSGKGTVQMGGSPKLTAAGKVTETAQAKYDKDVQKAAGRKQDFIEKLSGDGEGGSDPDSEDEATKRKREEQQAIADFEAKAAAEIGGAWRLNRVKEIENDKWMVDGESIAVQVEGRGEKNATLNDTQTLLAAQGIAQEEYAASLDTLNPAVSESEQDAYLEQMKFVDNFCRNQINSSNDTDLKEAWKNICANPINYIAGSTVGSLEYKLTNGQSTFCLDDKGKIDTEGKCTISAGLRTLAVEGNSELLSFLEPPGPGDSGRCESIQSKIGLHGRGGAERLIFFGDEGEEATYEDTQGNQSVVNIPSEGVVITPNPLQKFALEKLKNECEGLDWTPEIDPGEKGDEISPLRQVLHVALSTQNLNAIKGTLYERVPQITILLQNMRTAYDNGGKIATDPDFIKAKIALSDFLEETILTSDIPTLLQVKEKSQEAGSEDLQAYMDAEGAIKMLQIGTDPGKLQEWIISEAAAMEQWIGAQEGVVGTIHMGLSPRTGARADNALFFLDPKKARASAKRSQSSMRPMTYEELMKEAAPNAREGLEKRLKALGIDPNAKGFNPKQKYYTVPFGQKRMEQGGSTKAGEINTQQNMEEYFDETTTAATAPTPGFFRRLRGVQFGVDQNGDPKVTSSDPDFTDMVDYQNDLEDEVTHATRGFRETQTYKGKDGKVKIATPEQNLKMASEIILGKLSWPQLKKSPWARLFYKKGKKRKYSDPLVQERIQEGMQRKARFRQLERDLNDPKKRDLAQKYLVRNLLICGYNEYEMAQIKGTNDGKVQGWSQNAPMDDIAKAQRDGRLEITIGGRGGFQATYIIHKNKPNAKGEWQGEGRRVMTWQQEGQSSGSKASPTKEDTRHRQTRSVSRYVQEEVDRKNFVTDTRSERQDIYPGTESLLVQFLAGQQRLLERLLTPANMNQLL